jgi:DNA-binding beta-propeller fold protein YncE
MILRWISMLFTAGVVFAFVACATDRLYIVQSTDESLAAVYVENGTINPHVLDLGYGCNDIIVDGNRLFVTNSLLNSVQEIDANTESTIRSFPTTSGINPYSAAMINSDTLAVTCLLSNNLLLIRLSDGAIVGNIPIGLGPEGILAIGNYVYVCLTRYLDPGTFGPGAVMILDRNSLQVVDSLRVGINPQSIAADNQGHLHVVCTGNYSGIGGQINVFELPNHLADTVIATGGTPSAVSFGGGLAWVAAGGWGNNGLVMRYRLSDFTLLNGSQNPIATGIGATDVEALSDGSFFVSCYASNRVEYRSADGQLIHSYSTSAGPWQMVHFQNSAILPREEFFPTKIQLLTAYPNPFNGSVSLKLLKPATSDFNINIYNNIGEFVDQARIPTGDLERNWVPRQNGNQSISSGLYYAYIKTQEGTQTIKLWYQK